jgi:hypothetical protein
MPKKLLIINAILLSIAAGSIVLIVRQVVAPMAMPSPSGGRPSPAGPSPGASSDTSRPPAAAYAVVASKNLFSPSRTEAPITATAAAAAVKPNLYGIVLREGSPIAYLEDPTSKRVSGYRIGDAIAGGTLQTITADSVVITRPDGKMDVRLHDPNKPKPAPPAAAAAVPGQVPVGLPGLPGVIPPAVTAAPPGVVPGQPGALQPGQPVPGVQPNIPGRRALPPNLLRRIPQVPTADAPRQ